MKTKKLFFLCLLLPLFASFKSKNRVVDNTFVSIVINNSDFKIEVDGIQIESGGRTEHSFPLHESAVYDGWNVDYKIPLCDEVFYSLRSKKFLVDGQKEFVIENPTEKIPECISVLKNDSSVGVQLLGGGGARIVPVCTAGEISGTSMNYLYTIGSQKTAVFFVEDEKFFLALADNVGKKIALDVKKKKGYVHFISFDGKKVSVIDSRPIAKIYEKPWSKKYAENMVLHDVLQKDERVFVLGTEVRTDNKKNLYRTGFLECLDMDGKELWLQRFGAKGSDTNLYRMAFSGDDRLVAVGQSIRNDMKGIVLEYNFDGKLLKNFEIGTVVALDGIFGDGKNLVTTGYGLDGEEMTLSFDENFDFREGGSLISLCLGGNDRLFSELNGKIQEISAIKKDSKGNVYVSGETAFLEKPCACVAKIDKTKGTVDMLYVSGVENSYISCMILDENAGLLVMAGSEGGSDSFGNNGKSFFRCIETESGKVVWDGNQTLDFESSIAFTPSDDYGFFQILVNVDADGNASSPCALVKLDSAGKGAN